MILLLVTPQRFVGRLFRIWWRVYSLIVLRAYGVQLHKPLSIHFNGRTWLEINERAVVNIDEGVVSNSGSRYAIDTVVASKVSVRSGAKLSVGKYSGWTNTCIHVWESITIGMHVKIGAGCLIMDTNFHSTNWENRCDNVSGIDAANAKTAPVIIDDYAFVGARSIICKGVRIGKRAMVAAGSVVIHDVPDDCIVGGNPARIISRRAPQ